MPAASKYEMARIGDVDIHYLNAVREFLAGASR
jgi:hypothetical protein